MMENKISFKMKNSFYEIDDGKDDAIITIDCPDGKAKITTDNPFIVELFKEGARVNQKNQKLQSQLSKANELIADQIREICGLREALKNIRDLWDEGRDDISKIKEFIFDFNKNCDEESEMISDETDDMFIAREIADETILCAAPVDEEKEVYRTALSIACDAIIWLQKNLNNGYHENHNVIMHDYINQARFRIEGRIKNE